ncbi:MAG: hypothetical protein M1835_007650 [Candelina submexicana]|nr:MAG: hypothetical protein M1835_007650 [Candelina submexicana]
MEGTVPRPSSRALEAGLHNPFGDSLPYSTARRSHERLFGPLATQPTMATNNSPTHFLRPRPAAVGTRGLRHAVVAIQGSRQHYTDMIYSCGHAYKMTLTVPVLPDNVDTRAVVPSWILEGHDHAHPYINRYRHACEKCIERNLQNANHERQVMLEERMRVGTLSVLAITAALIIVRLLRSVKPDMVSRIVDVGVLSLLAVAAIMVAASLRRYERQDVAKGMVDLAILLVIAVAVQLLVARIMSPLLSSLFAFLPLDEH